MNERRCQYVRFVAMVIAAVSLLTGSPLAGMSSAASQKASELYQKKDWSSLLNIAAPYARADAKDGWAWYYVGLADDGLGRKDQAAAAYENALNMVPDYLRGSVITLLGQDYSALRQNDKLVALYHSLQKSHPDLAVSLQSQFHDVLAASPTPAAPMPEISPRTLAAMTANARRIWRPDAIPVMVNISDIGKGFQVVFDFYSPGTKTGLAVVQALGGTNTSTVANPNWGQSAIPATFLSLDAAVARAPQAGAPGTLDHAFLYRTGDGGPEAVDLIWALAMKSDSVRGAAIPAYIMPKDRFDRILGAAEKGDTNSQVLLARVYTLGLTGTQDPVQAFKWCSQSATHANAEAANMLGQMYQFGQGTPPNLELAVHWYQIAANSGFPPGEYNLGLMYESGRGVGQSYIIAQQLIAKAAKQGLGEAMGELPYVTARARGQQQQAQIAAAKRTTRCQWSFQWYNPAIGMCVVSAVRLAPPSGH